MSLPYIDAWPYCCYCGGKIAEDHEPLPHTAFMCLKCRRARARDMKHAIRLVSRAIRDGALPPLTSAICGCGKPALVYEHRDYRRPLDVEPVCKSCNRKRGPALWNPDEKISYESALVAKTIGRK